MVYVLRELAWGIDIRVESLQLFDHIFVTQNKVKRI